MSIKALHYLSISIYLSIYLSIYISKRLTKTVKVVKVQHKHSQLFFAL